MITKDQLELLKQPARENKELRYTIGGAIETVVHSNLESERIGQLQRGHQVMNRAVQSFRSEMAFKSREGLAKSQFQYSADVIPPSDQKLAEQTWRQNHLSAHESTLGKASKQFRTAIKGASKGELPPIDTDLGYGAGQDPVTVDHYVNHGAKQTALRSDRVKSFARTMNQNRSQQQDLER